jgi:hypothetical protein
VGGSVPSVLEIDRKLRDDFRRRVKDFGVSSDTTDPLLAVLFRTVAQQIDGVYGDTDRLRQSLLRELMSGLHVQQYAALPAQAAVRFLNQQAAPRRLRAGTELNAVAATGERLVFSLDATVEISQARVSLALSYQDQLLRLVPGVEMSESVESLRPSSEAVPVALGPYPCLFLAFEDLPPSLLSRHGLFFDLGPGNYPVQHALCHEPWWMVGRDGELSGDGLLRPRRGNAGVYQLAFQTGTAAEEREEGLPGIPDGFYTGRQFVFPDIPEGREFLCGCPRLLEAALGRMVSRSPGQLLATPRLWIKIDMPPGTPALHHALHGVHLHAMTASNIFTRNRTVDFRRDGVSVPLVRQSEIPEHLVAPISVISAENEEYQQGNHPLARATSGRFELHSDRVTLYPGAHADGSPHRSANVRLWLTNGELANRVGPGGVTGFANPAALSGIRVVPLTAAAGGSDGETAASAERRFADALLTRGRIVTRTDLTTSALAVDRRVLSATASSAIERRQEGLRRVERLRLTLDSAAFTRPEVELPALRSQIDASLRSRLVQGIELEVEFLWN